MKYYDRNGKEIDFTTWGRLLGDIKYKIVKQDTLKNGKVVSTVWLGLDHGIGLKPEIFETMVFPSKGNWGDELCERYATLKEAEAGHKKIINLTK